MATTRTPINRPTKSKITPAAVDAFKRMLKLREGSDQWWELNGTLCRELKLPPWEWPAYQHPDAVAPYPEGSPAALNWKPDFNGQARYRALCDAAGIETEKE